MNKAQLRAVSPSGSRSISRPPVTTTTMLMPTLKSTRRIQSSMPGSNRALIAR